MDYGMISQIEKARRYAEEPGRIKFNNLTVLFTGDHDIYTVSLNDTQWHCSCSGFENHGICPHVMTLERVLKPMLRVRPLPYAQGQNVVSDVEKAHRYAGERDRIKFTTFDATFHGNNSDHRLTYDNGQWHCDSVSFKLRGVSSHTIAMERILKGMIVPTLAHAPA